MAPRADPMDLAFNRRGRISPWQWAYVFRRTLYQPAAVIAPVVFTLWWPIELLRQGVIPVFSLGAGVMIGVSLFGAAAAWYRPLLFDLVVGSVVVKEGEIKKGSTLGVARRIWYVMVEGVPFSMSRSERDRLEPGRYRAYMLPRTHRLVALERLG